MTLQIAKNNSKDQWDSPITLAPFGRAGGKSVCKTMKIAVNDHIGFLGITGSSRSGITKITITTVLG
jgi:hypothetical protein